MRGSGGLNVTPPLSLAAPFKEGTEEGGCHGPAWLTAGGLQACMWEKKGHSGKEWQGEQEGHENTGEFPARGRASEEAGHGHVGVALSRLKPLLQTPPAVPTLRARLERVAPDLLTQVSRGREVMGERVTGGSCRTAALPCERLRYG